MGRGFDPANEWTLQLQRIRQLGSAVQRLHALLGLQGRRLDHPVCCRASAASSCCRCQAVKAACG
jgi:hypothetical protein